MKTAVSRDARAFAEALFSNEHGAPPAERIDWLLRELSDFVSHAGARTQLILRGGLVTASWLAPPLIGKAPPLAALSVTDRCRALEKLEHTPAGLPLLALKAMLCIIYYEHPDVLRESGITRGDEQAPGCMKHDGRASGTTVVQ
jgi:hypothetical protein